MPILDLSPCLLDWVLAANIEAEKTTILRLVIPYVWQIFTFSWAEIIEVNVTGECEGRTEGYLLYLWWDHTSMIRVFLTTDTPLFTINEFNIISVIRFTVAPPSMSKLRSKIKLSCWLYKAEVVCFVNMLEVTSLHVCLARVLCSQYWKACMKPKREESCQTDFRWRDVNVSSESPFTLRKVLCSKRDS